MGFVNTSSEALDQLRESFVPSARRLECQSANPDIAGHHALAGEHFEDFQNLFAFPEAVEVDRHRADIESVRAKPHEVAINPAQFAEHHSHPLSKGRNF